MITYLYEHFLCPRRNDTFFQMHNLDIILCHQNLKCFNETFARHRKGKKTFRPLISIVTCHFGLKPVRPTFLNFKTCFYSSIFFWIILKKHISDQSAENDKNKQLITRLSTRKMATQYTVLLFLAATTFAA